MCVCMCVKYWGVYLLWYVGRFPVGSGRRKWRESLDVWTDCRVSKWNACLGEWKGDGSLLDPLWQNEVIESPVFTGYWESSWTQWAFLFRWAMEVRRKSCDWGNRRETMINPVGLTRNGFHGFPIESEWWLSCVERVFWTSKLPTTLCHSVEQCVCMVGRQEEKRGVFVLLCWEG